MTPEERRHTVSDLLLDSLERMSPGNAVRENLKLSEAGNRLWIAGEELALGNDQKIGVIGCGKAAVMMARTVEEMLGDRIADGLVIAPDKPDRSERLKRIQVLKGSHPVPDKESLSSTYELIDFARKIPEDHPVICLISGGTSALLCMPAEPLEVQEVGELHKLLLESGMDIHQMNTVRKAVSNVKAGGLLKFLQHTRLYDLVISDVPGDKLSSIGSGPTCFEPKNYDESFKLLKQYELWNRIPHSVRAYIAKGMHEKQSETAPELSIHHSAIISSAGKLAKEIAGRARKAGFDTSVVDPAYNHPIDEVERMILDQIEAQHDEGEDREEENNEGQGKKCRVFYGESSVHVEGQGKGGRNQELALRLARHIHPDRPVTIACMGTDGVDGPTDAAGAIVDETTLPEAKKKGLNADTFLRENDSWNFFRQAGGHIKTGPTGNNLMDVVVVVG